MKSGLSAWLGVTVLVLAGGCFAGCGDDEGENQARETCSLGGQRCDFGCSKSLGCVECEFDGDCPDGTPVCVLGECTECGANADCGTSQACHPRNHECGPACQDDGACNGDSPFCDEASGQCVGCLEGQPCPQERPVCSPERRQCSECASDRDCPLARPACDLQDGDCEECLVDSHCRAGSRCGSDHECHEACSANADCVEGNRPVCDVASGNCVECLANGDCGTAEPICREGSCIVCNDNADCPAERPFCRDRNECVECLDDRNCSAPLPVCNNEVCVECDNDEDCADPALPNCDNLRCVAQ